MNISSETDSLEREKGFPIEVNSIVLSANGVQNVYPDSDNQEERNDSEIYKSSINPHLLDTTTSDSENRKLGDRILIDIENDTSAYGNEFDICLTQKAESLNSSSVDLCSAPLLSPEDDDIFKEESHTTTDNSSPQENDIFNRFLYELYEKELDLHNKFSDQEINDIRTAVIKQVNLLVKRIHEIDSRLKIHEVLLVGSVREGTQIIRPCEYDFILTLEALSKPGAVSIKPEDPEGHDLEYMHVKLEDNDIKSVFHEFSDNGNVIATRLLPWNRQGLRDLYYTAVRQAVTLCSRSCVMMDAGKLKLKRRKPKKNGPACTISLLWERAITEKYTTMEISVDLCSALKVDFEDYYSLLPPSDISTFSSLHRTVVNLDSHDLNNAKSISSVLHAPGNAVSNDLDHAKNIKSVLLMPRDGMRFKVTFTESELFLTSNLSEHHRKCYRLLKYLVNGEPFPREGSRCSRFFHNPHTCFHSYILKRAVWEHHYIQHCVQDTNLGICVIEILPKLDAASARGLIHPYNKNRIIDTSSEWQDKIPAVEITATSKLDFLKHVFWKLKNAPTDAYDYKAYFDSIFLLHNMDQKIVYLASYLIIGFLMTGLAYVMFTVNICYLIAIFLSAGVFIYVLSAHRVIYDKWRILAIPLSLCTKHIDVWVIGTWMTILLLLNLLQPVLVLVPICVGVVIVILPIFILKKAWIELF